ncbi:PEP-utilizing enzyme [Bacteroidota bacterium]
MSWKKLLTRKNSIFMDSMKLLGASHLYVNLGYDYRIKNYKIVNGANYVGQDYEVYIENLKSEYKKNREILNNIFSSGISDIKKLEKTWKQIKKTNTNKLSDIELKKIFDKYVDSLYRLMAYLFTPLFAEKILTGEVSSIIAKYSDEESIKRLLPILTASEELSMVQKENIDFYELMKKISMSKTENNTLIENHLSKWAWLGDHNYFGYFWTSNEIILRIKNSKNKDFTKEISNIKQDLENTKKEYCSVIKKWNPSEKEKNIIRLTKKFVYFRTFRLDMLFYSELLVQNLLLETAKRLGLSYRELMMLSPSEVSNSILKKNNFKNEISERNKFYAIILIGGQVKIYSGKKAEEFLESEQGDESVKELRGNPAYPGIVRGNARIIIDKTDFKNFSSKEVLVSPMTTPDFVPLMERCSAIVTDEGGITCHAAIVSREMKKPCIMGTRNATRILKDGDLIEVNAGTGIIKILKSKRV